MPQCGEPLLLTDLLCSDLGLGAADVSTEASRVHYADRWHGGGVAAGGARATAGVAGDRFSERRITWPIRAFSDRISEGPDGNGLYRWPQCSDRIPLGRRPK